MLTVPSGAIVNQFNTRLLTVTCSMSVMNSATLNRSYGFGWEASQFVPCNCHPERSAKRAVEGPAPQVRLLPCAARPTSTSDFPHH